MKMFKRLSSEADKKEYFTDIDSPETEDSVLSILPASLLVQYVLPFLDAASLTRIGIASRDLLKAHRRRIYGGDWLGENAQIALITQSKQAV